tara:strand:+ start:716 stop:1222 length:507 start_codon:yes stop_codon:yes gene_type:complete
MRILIIFIFLITNSYADVSDIKNIVIHKDPKTHDNVIFLDKNDKKINIKKYNGSLLLLNFWATWCEPCKVEMPSLDKLQSDPDFDNLKIFAINVGKESKKKIDNFFFDLDIKNFVSYYDSPVTLAKTFSLRGIPTSILINKNGKEFARIIGSVNFNNPKFINWLKNYN